MLAAVIVPSATPALFRRLADSLDFNGPKLVVANSDDLSARIAVRREAAQLGWMVVYPGRNLGFAGACNAGAAIFPGHHVVLLNDDLVAQPYFVQQLVHELETHPADVMGATLLRPDGRVDHAGIHHEAAGLFWKHRTERLHCAARMPGVTFAAVAIRRALWDRLGGLDEGFWYACEDQDFCLRALLERRARIYCSAHAVATHHTSGTRNPAEVDTKARARLRELWTEEAAREALEDWNR